MTQLPRTEANSGRGDPGSACFDQSHEILAGVQLLDRYNQSPDASCSAAGLSFVRFRLSRPAAFGRVSVVPVPHASLLKPFGSAAACTSLFLTACRDGR